VNQFAPWAGSRSRAAVEPVFSRQYTTSVSSTRGVLGYADGVQCLAGVPFQRIPVARPARDPDGRTRDTLDKQGSFHSVAAEGRSSADRGPLAPCQSCGSPRRERPPVRKTPHVPKEADSRSAPPACRRTIRRRASHGCHRPWTWATRKAAPGRAQITPVSRECDPESRLVCLRFPVSHPRAVLNMRVAECNRVLPKSHALRYNVPENQTRAATGSTECGHNLRRAQLTRRRFSR
jgi:hypothetical protein